MDDKLSLPGQAERCASLLEPYLRPAPVVVVISGPSGVGKDSVVKRMAEQGHPFHFVITATDRGMRPGEVNGVDYFFVSRDAFQRMICEDALLEYAVVYGQSKGVPRQQVREALASGQDVIMRLDVQGAATIRRKLPDSIGIFLLPPSLDVLVRRLRQRPGDSEAQVQERVRMAVLEMEQACAFQYVVVNYEGELDRAVEQVLAIIAAEKCRTGRAPLNI